ncbi:MAG: AmmeMemoRadiSam system radical SAM enzyme [Candidatus Omnitrophica bacterium]|nr:AmmeMemoRadiSam system radical SAM enzyme [Candidatus Omnitrophota bacterium]
MNKEALLYEQSDNGRLRCVLCSHYCRIAPGETGRCGIRHNVAGKLYTASYGKLIAANCDPIEKKPLYHFLPGTLSYSIATPGCNFRCEFCQNWQISQTPLESQENLPGVGADTVVGDALANECRSIAYTYTEPTIFFEYAYDISQISHKKGIANVFVTNGYMTDKMIDLIRPYLDAANIDLKSFSERFYKERCGGTLRPVLDSIRRMKESGIWVEVTTLIVPGANDSQEELADIAGFIAGVDRDIPWHISRFYPQYKLRSNFPTPLNILHQAREIGLNAGLKYVYLGNVGEGADTVCPACGERLIRREGFFVSENKIKEGRCPSCGEKIAGVWQ